MVAMWIMRVVVAIKTDITGVAVSTIISVVAAARGRCIGLRLK
uniref:Uncharacterized protein n=1 Tax=Romanomermis culicivorax TaxID=13658 RepID=A0A915LE47_ROMCU